jgi:YD repeat-containing protein
VDPNEMYQYTDIVTETGLVKLTEVRDSSFLDGGNITQITKHFYNNLDKQYEVSATYQTNSNCSTLKKWFKYPKDIAIAPYTSMANLNMLSQVIITTDSLDNKFLQESQTVYSPWQNTFYAPSSLTVKRGTGAKETEMTYHKYDKFGNPLYISRYDADYVVYLWSYNYQYPIAEISGATYDEVKSALAYSDTQIESLAAQSNPDVNWVDSRLRAYFNNKTSHVTTYTCKPLVGVSTMTDPRGIVTKYDYDAFGRLIKVTRGNEVIETYDYRYRD